MHFTRVSAQAITFALYPFHVRNLRMRCAMKLVQSHAHEKTNVFPQPLKPTIQISNFVAPFGSSHSFMSATS